MLGRIALFFRTVKYLKAVQVFSRIRRKVVHPKVSLHLAPRLTPQIHPLCPVIKRPQSMYGSMEFKLLNETFTLRHPEDWNSKDRSKLYLYNLHYFDDLNSADASQRFDLHSELIQKWISENPIGLGNGWEPYPSSLRIVNWIKWFLLQKDRNQTWIDSLYLQTRLLEKSLEFHLLGNHLFSNAKALIFSGLFFQGGEADNWYRKGLKILNIEMPEQILPDGGNFELSPMYHAIFLEDLLDLINIHNAYNADIPNSLVSTSKEMFNWLNAMCHPDGGIAFFNDSALNVAPTLRELLAYSNRLGIPSRPINNEGLTHLRDSGYIRACKKNAVVIADIANIGPDYIPGHGHADTLSFEMSLFSHRLIVNSGISTYGVGKERHRQRSTESHSTITVDKENSSEVWHGFRVGRRAKVFNIESDSSNAKLSFSACHDGYQRLKGRVIHCREWNLYDQLLEVSDMIDGSGEHEVKSVLPLHPEVRVLGSDVEGVVDLQVGGRNVKVSIKAQGGMEVVPSQYHPEFGMSIDNYSIVYSYNGPLPTNVKVEISW